jgi:hypothetical protein
LKLDALDHPKTFDLAARLGIELPTVLGHLELLWAFTGKQAPQGNVGKWPDGAIARACYWMGRPEVFIQALQEAGFIDADPTHRLTVHDWREHAPRWVKSKLKSLGQSFIGDVSGDTSSDTGGDDDEDIGAPSKGREGKGSEGKGSLGADAPDGLDATVWTQWAAYRRQIGKPLKPASIPAAQLALAAYGSDQAAVVAQSIAQGWQGLFPLKDVRSRGQKAEDANVDAALKWARK